MNAPACRQDTDYGWIDALESQLAAGTVHRRQEPMARHTTLRVGGPADLYIEPADETELSRIVRFCHNHRVPWLVLGRGSNLLVRDRGIRGVVICLNQPAFSAVLVRGERLYCGAGARLKSIAQEARRASLAGLEFLDGIPGSLGGALRMNAGAHQRSLFDVVETVRFMNRQGEVQEQPGPSLGARYRHCPWFDEHIALGAVLLGQPDQPERIQERIQEFNQRRWATQPAAPSAGCIFKNPPNDSAGRLIDQLGLKGRRVGGAVVSEAHGNFIVTDETATAQDVLALIDLIRAEVKTRLGLDLEPEVQIVGE